LSLSTKEGRLQFTVQYPGNTLGSIITFHSVSLGFLRNCSCHWTMHGLCNRLVKNENRLGKFVRFSNICLVFVLGGLFFSGVSGFASGTVRRIGRGLRRMARRYRKAACRLAFVRLAYLSRKEMP